MPNQRRLLKMPVKKGPYSGEDDIKFQRANRTRAIRSLLILAGRSIATGKSTMTLQGRSSPMIRLKSKQAKPVETSVSLADRIKAVCSEAEAYVETKVRELKNSPDGRLLPIDWLRSDLRKRHGGSCHCKCALSLME